MKTLYKLTCALAVLPLFFTSCVEEVADRTEFPDSDCQNIYFQKLQNPEIELEPAAPKELVFKAYRQLKSNPEDLAAVTVPFKLEASLLESGEKAFSVSEIAFEEGQVETEFKVTFPDAKVGVTYDCTIEVTDPDFVSEYSKDPTKIFFNVTRVKWVPVVGEDGEKTGLFCDGLLCEMLTGLKPFYKKPVEIQRRADKQGIYRIRDLYNDEYLARMLDIPVEMISQTGIKFKPSAVVIDASDPKKVVWRKSSIGVDIGYGDIYFFSLVPDYYPSFTEADARYGTMADGIISFPPAGIAFETGSLSSVINEAGKTKLVFPGYHDADYTLQVKAGMSDKEGKLPVEIVRGADVKTIKYTVMQGALPPLGIVKAANKIGDGSLEAETLASGAKKLEVKMEKTGVYTLVLAGFDKDGNYVANVGTKLSYVAAGDEEPVLLNCGIIISDKYASQGNTSENSMEIYISGKNLTEVHYGLFPKDLYDSMPDDIRKALKATKPLPEKVMDMVNTDVWSGVIGDLQPGTEFVLLVSASNGFAERLDIKTAKTEGEFDPLQADYFPASLHSDKVTKADFLNKKMCLYQYEQEAGKRVNLGEVTLKDGGQMEAEGKQVELIDIEGIWTAAAGADKNFKIERDVTTFVFMDGLLFNWKSEFGKVTAEVVDPATGQSFLHTAPGAMTSIFQSQFMGPIPLSYVGGFTKEGNIAFMDSGEYAMDEGGCLAIGLGLYSDTRYDELNAIISVLSDFILACPEEDVPGGKTAATTGKAVQTLLQRSAAPIRPSGRLMDIRTEYDGQPAVFEAGHQF